jgi:hypothetical protein
VSDRDNGVATATVIFAHRHVTSSSLVIGESLVIVFDSWLAASTGVFIMLRGLRTQMTLLACILPLGHVFGHQRLYCLEKDSFCAFLRSIAAMESVGMGNIGKCCVKGQLCPLETTVRQLASVIFAHRHLTSGSPVIGESLVIVFDSWLAASTVYQICHCDAFGPS